jgi:hypothetical protein
MNEVKTLGSASATTVATITIAQVLDYLIEWNGTTKTVKLTKGKR